MNTKNFIKGDELCRVIEEFAELEWRKFQSRTTEIALNSGGIYREDHSKFPPYTSIRFKSENPQFVAELKYAIESYKGSLAWHISSHQRYSLPGTNWVIRPIFVEQLTNEKINPGTQEGKRYIAEHYPGFAEIAYADMLGLAGYVREVLMATKARWG